MKRVSCDISTHFACYLYSTKQTCIIKTMSKHSQQYYTSEQLIRDLLPHDFLSPNSDTQPGRVKQVLILCDICTCYMRYLYSKEQRWIIIAFSCSSRTHPNFVLQAREIEIFYEDCKLAAPLGFSKRLWASFSCPSVTSCLAFDVLRFL